MIFNHLQKAFELLKSATREAPAVALTAARLSGPALRIFSQLEILPLLKSIKWLAPEDPLAHQQLLRCREMLASFRQEGVHSSESLLHFYFAQIFQDGPWLLNLRALKSLEQADSQSPLGSTPLGTLFFFPNSEWVAQVRQLYCGFYLHSEDRSAFRQSLAAWGLESCEELLLEHFGGDQQEAVRFDLRYFQATFTELLQKVGSKSNESAAKSSGKLPAEMLALGFILVSLYSELETTGKSYPVRSIFMREWQRWQRQQGDAAVAEDSTLS